eukprot:scaffold8784_cov65-Phaeocystis_antarctica.AAC.3
MCSGGGMGDEDGEDGALGPSSVGEEEESVLAPASVSEMSSSSSSSEVSARDMRRGLRSCTRTWSRPSALCLFALCLRGSGEEGNFNFALFALFRTFRSLIPLPLLLFSLFFLRRHQIFPQPIDPCRGV